MAAQCQGAKQSGRKVGMARQSFGNMRGQVSEIHHMGGNRVVPANHLAIWCQDENCSHVLADILTRLPFQVAIKRLDSTRKSRPVVLVTERLNSISNFTLRLFHESPMRRR